MGRGHGNDRGPYRAGRVQDQAGLAERAGDGGTVILLRHGQRRCGLRGAGATADGELFPTRTVPQAVIDQALYTAGNSRGSAERIAVFYMRQRPEAECTAFLRREFGTENGRGIEYDGQKYAVWFMEDGIHMAQGDSIRTGHSRTTVTWEQASARILELLEAGTYLSTSELEQAQDKVLLEMGDALLMTARDRPRRAARRGCSHRHLPSTTSARDIRSWTRIWWPLPRTKADLQHWPRNTTPF